MKILIINYRFFNSGGPEKYMFSIIHKLEKEGHKVIPFSIQSKYNVQTNYEKYFAEPIGSKEQTYFEEYRKTPRTLLQIVVRQFYSFYVKKKLEQLIKDTQPDICYLLHHYNKLSPSVIDACKKHKLPIVMRLSDFFPICASNLLLRNNQICEDCLKKNLLQAVKNKCVKNSRFGSLLKASAMYFHRLIGIYNKIDCIVAPAQFTLTKVIPFFDEKKCVQIPTFTDTEKSFNDNVGKYVLYVGRLEEEKGVLNLIKAMNGLNYTLKIVGKSSTGYEKVLENYVLENKMNNIEFLGQKTQDELITIYTHAICVVLPSICYDNMPNVALEAMSFSRPLIVSNLGSMKELVTHGENGFLFEPGDIADLKSKILLILENNNSFMRKASYQSAINIHHADVHYQKLIKIFNSLVVK